MDRNLLSPAGLRWTAVALRKESVDRNSISSAVLWSACVALRKESVDRNFSISWEYGMGSMSLSARRAWIEITAVQNVVGVISVALRKESVDRNTYGRCVLRIVSVALRKESVDRNCGVLGNFGERPRRSPQGERG